MPMPIEKVYLMSSYRGYLAPLKMMGPLHYPIETSKDIMMQLLSLNVPLIRYDPATKNSVAITIDNYETPFSKNASGMNENVIAELPVKGVRVNTNHSNNPINPENTPNATGDIIYRSNTSTDETVTDDDTTEDKNDSKNSESSEESSSPENDESQESNESTENKVDEPISTNSNDNKSSSDTQHLTKAQKKALRAAQAKAAEESATTK